MLMTFSSHENGEDRLGLQIIHIEKQIMRFDFSQEREI